MPSPVKAAVPTTAPTEPTSVSPKAPAGMADFRDTLDRPRETASYCGKCCDRVRMFFEAVYHWILKALCCTPIPNFAQVDDNLYRGAQPTLDGYKMLQNKGVKAVINLRSLDTPEELERARQDVESTGLKFFHLPLSTTEPTKEHMQKLFQIFSEEKGPFFIHCFFGSDRTGFTAAFYRVFVKEWEKEKAIEEMIGGGFGYHSSISIGLRETLERESRESLELDSQELF